MDGLGFQGMPRFALTPAEEALVPRPHSTASQVASAVPSTYTRRGSSAPPSPLHSRHHRPQYVRKHNENTVANHPYPSHRHAGGASNSNPLGLSVSFSSHSIQSQQQQQLPSRSSPMAPSPAGLPSDTDEQEYPQNPQDNYHPSVLSPPRRSFSLTPRANKPVSPQNSDHNNNSPAYPSSSSHAFHAHGSLDSYPHRGSAVHLPQSHQASWDSSVRVDSPEPLTDSDDSYHASKDIPRQPRRSSNQGFFGSRRGSAVAQSNQIPVEGSSRISLGSEQPNRNSQDLPEGLSCRSPRTKPHGQKDFSDEERQEPRRSRSGWRPSLSLIRQESSSFTMQVLPQPRRYLQNDQRRVSDMVPPDDPHPTKTRRRRKKKRKGSSRKRPKENLHGAYGHDTDDFYALPDLFQVLEKKTRHPLSYDDFEAFLRRQRAVEYLNFWTDVTAHEQLCRTFEVSERRFKRELQLEDWAFARERRRQNLDASLEAGRFSPDPGMGGAAVPEDGHGLNISNLYITSRSSLQLPLNDHLSFPLETRRYGLQDSSSPFPPMPPSLAQRRGSEQRPMGAYNRLLAGAGGRRTSLDRSRYSLDESPIPEQEGDSSASAPSIPRIHTRGSIDAFGHSKLVGRRPSETEDHIHHRPLDRPAVSSPLNPTRPALQEQSVQKEMDQLAQAVEASIQSSLGLSQTDIEPMPQASVQSLRIVEPILERRPSVVNFEGGHGPLLPPPAIRRSGESAYAPSVHKESVQRIYRKYLVQLRTMSMAAEEEAAAAAAAATKASNGTNPHESATRNSLDKSIAPGWDGYAEQVISEWNEKWRRRDSNARRARRTSARRSISGRGAVAPRHGTNDNMTGGEAAGGRQISPMKKSANSKAALDQDSQEDDSQDTERGPKNPKRPKIKRETTGTGITAFLSRLLRTETTVVELPTLTINTTTVEEDYEYETDESEYDEDAEYDSDDEQEDDDAEESGGMKTNQPRIPTTKNVLQLGIKAPEPLFLKDRNQELASPSTIADEHYTSTVNGSLAGDRAVSEAGTHDSAIPLQSLFARPSVDTQRHPLAPPFSTDALAPAGAKLRQTPVSALVQGAATTSIAIATAAPRPSIAGSSTVATSAIAAAFYLPLECRQRIHAQVQQEGRTDAPHLFGPAKNFVVDVVLQEHYYPLFLEYVKVQNLGLLHESHINNRIKRQGVISLGVAVWVVVLALQITLVMMAWGGWSSPWVWLVGVIGGYPGSLFLATGLTKFSPILGLVGKMYRGGQARGSIQKNHGAVNCETAPQEGAMDDV
ncbi:hypothetical protein BGZ95_005139 [Linnemannia exigua]|uniref:RGS domain-containing protein n=1 Tax=Linnemannia exigua TaxID=604196 RepID=A0AAD4D2K9_9FUNG|nr:hypothetical protein BGZ95_005139 [Linnemannia exigua]